jgi:membrane-associated protease RseP (regulator of RpoE activity)
LAKSSRKASSTVRKAGAAAKSGASNSLNAAVVLLAILEFAFIYFDYNYAWTGVAARWASGLASLFIVGVVIQREKHFAGGYGMFLLSSKHGIAAIDEISQKHKTFWNEMAIWGFVLGFGLFAWPLLKGKISKKTYAFGFASLILIMLFVVPYMSLSLQFINLPQLQTAIAQQEASTAAHTGINYPGIVLDGSTFVFGFTGYVIVAIMYNAAKILYALALFLATVSAGHPQVSQLSGQVAGVAPVIPGIDLPLAAGVLALALMLIVHEFSHGILARNAKVKLKSIGLVILGVIPMGAFVEPEEKEVVKLDSMKQTKIFAAGISANFVAMLVFFVFVVLLFYYVLPYITHDAVVVAATIPGFPANGIVPIGSQITSWDGVHVSNIAQLEGIASKDRPGQTVAITTNTGSFSFVAKPLNSTSTLGLIGVDLEQESLVNPGAVAAALYFIYTFVSLSFLLNFLVGVVNLLPLPSLDGWRIYKTNFKNQKFVSALTAIVLIGLIVNIFPWFF